MKNIFFYWIGFLLLILNKLRHTLKGYTDPRGFSIHKINRAIAYDKYVLSRLFHHLETYTGKTPTLQEKTILELGPGADLGIGMLTLAYGAKQYNALDKNNLIDTVPEKFYTQLFSDLKNDPKRIIPISSLQDSLRNVSAEKNTNLRYVCRNDFDPSIFEKESIDLVFSQAAFEHFDDVQKTFSQLAPVVKSGGILIAEIDLKTHTRFLRDRDPLNIYRYSENLYQSFRFLGSPNRLRPFDYKKFLESSDWTDIEIQPIKIVPEKILKTVLPSLAKKFQNKKNEMEILEFVLCARKK